MDATTWMRIRLIQGPAQQELVQRVEPKVVPSTTGRNLALDKTHCFRTLAHGGSSCPCPGTAGQRMSIDAATASARAAADALDFELQRQDLASRLESASVQIGLLGTIELELQQRAGPGIDHNRTRPIPRIDELARNVVMNVRINMLM